MKYKYSSSGHSYKDFSGYQKDIIHLYFCTKPLYTFNKTPFNPASVNILPFKQYSLGIWKWIAQESKIFKQSPVQIRERIKKQFGVNMAENTIRDSIKEIDVFLSNKIDKKTREILKKQGKILLAMDGQKTDDEGDALWLFVDLISNRVLKVSILESADYKTLHQEVEGILNEYQVKIIGGVSDKQN